jgi:hypothetical protein
MIRLILVLIVQLFVTDFAMASESAYVPTRRFIPLPTPKHNLNQQQAIDQPQAKFFPITQTRYPMVIRSEKNSIAGEIVKENSEIKNVARNINAELPDNFDSKVWSGKKVNMSEDDAKQIISIFTATK